MRSSSTKFAYSIAEVATLTSIGRTKLYDEIKNDRLRTKKIGRRRVVTSAALWEWLGGSSPLTDK
jgi:excisionase family DNA binding protein